MLVMLFIYQKESKYRFEKQRKRGLQRHTYPTHQGSKRHILMHNSIECAKNIMTVFCCSFLLGPTCWWAGARSTKQWVVFFSGQADWMVNKPFITEFRPWGTSPPTFPHPTWLTWDGGWIAIPRNIRNPTSGSSSALVYDTCPFFCNSALGYNSWPGLSVSWMGEPRSLPPWSHICEVLSIGCCEALRLARALPPGFSLLCTCTPSFLVPRELFGLGSCPHPV